MEVTARTESLFDDLLRVAQAARPDIDPEFLRRAYETAEAAHRGQTRRTGEPYIAHPVAVATLLADLKLDDKTLAAALLHDVIEDTRLTATQLRHDFGREVARLVEGVTKLRGLEFTSTREQQAENLRKMVLAMARDVRVVLIKLADRLHNVQTLHVLPRETAERTARETLEVFAPLARRMGVTTFVWKLEDRALRYLEPEKYEEIVQGLNRTRIEREQIVQRAIQKLRGRLRRVRIRAEITGRPKHIYSIFEKMAREGVDFQQILDLEAIRVIVDKPEQCYGALGQVHDLWTPLPGMFSDYIANPKPNDYQSLHTKVVGPHGGPMEVQIRTWEMHAVAEFGVAAHYQYKEGSGTQRARSDRRVKWLQQLAALGSEVPDPHEWLDALQADLFQDQVFVFTPKGDVIDLPRDATPVDFAYHIHSEVGNRCRGAKVNGKQVALHYRLESGDVVEIATSKEGSGPRLDWLQFVRSSGARNKIKQWYRREQRDESIARGRELLVAECQRQGVSFDDALQNGALDKVAQRLNYKGADDILAAIGYGDLGAEGIARRAREALGIPAEVTLPSKAPVMDTAPAAAILAAGDESVLTRLSRCCSPVPGDTIAGYVTRGRGITVHRTDCPNLQYYEKLEPERLTPVRWNLAEHAMYPVELRILAFDRLGLLSAITSIISDHKTNIRSADVTVADDGLAHFRLVVDISDRAHLSRVIERVRGLTDVLQVERGGAVH